MFVSRGLPIFHYGWIWKWALSFLPMKNIIIWYSFYSTSRRRGKLSPTDLWLHPRNVGLRSSELIFHDLHIYLFNFYKLIENTVETEKTLAAIQSSFHPLSIPKRVLLGSSLGEAFLTVDIRNNITFLPPQNQS